MKKYFSIFFPALLGGCFLGAFPFYFSGFFPDFTSAFFESVSGFTTTGATVLINIDELPGWLLLWRAITQWIGGIGILLVFVQLPVFTANGFQLKKIEVTDLEHKGFTPRLFRHSFKIILIYVSLTALQTVLFVIFGMGWFDALTHSFSTMSTGGFSIRSGGIAYYNSAAIEWVCIIFMFLAGFNFSLIWLFFSGKRKSVFKNSEARAYTGIILTAAVIITASILRQSPSLERAVRQAFFHAVSFISTTGFYSVDYTGWPSPAQGVLFFLLFIGGCSFSAAGGIKVIRYVILSKQTWNEMKRLVHPRGIFNICLDGKSGNKRAVHGAVSFVFLYLVIVFITALLVSTSGTDIFTSLNTALACQGNTGLGSSLPFRDFPGYVKIGLCFVMIIGRLELWMAFVLFSKNFWRR
jgi:trk system potassium uptake protein TrkH